MDDIQPTTDPVRPKAPLRSWFDVRGRSLSTLAFALNRLTAIGLTVYLFLHLAVLSMLLGGPESWNRFLAVARSPFFLLLDVVLLFGVVYHMANGIRVALVGMGVGHTQHKTMFYVLVGLALVLFVVGAALIFVG
ncbi:MAG TPA: succinate dehydrogenase, cytochrome b556 subunit [Promineifilum sp.]|nr:succinate dehydrogenase, cytochrome b556 subunit [Promineifilum sp.]HQF69997.1 succinate dehydrogenase, cytochrome b556 subunit [Promineifilum sp.]